MRYWLPHHHSSRRQVNGDGHPTSSPSAFSGDAAAVSVIDHAVAAATPLSPHNEPSSPSSSRSPSPRYSPHNSTPPPPRAETGWFNQRAAASSARHPPLHPACGLSRFGCSWNGCRHSRARAPVALYRRVFCNRMLTACNVCTIFCILCQSQCDVDNIFLLCCNSVDYCFIPQFKFVIFNISGDFDLIIPPGSFCRPCNQILQDAKSDFSLESLLDEHTLEAPQTAVESFAVEMFQVLIALLTQLTWHASI